MCNVKGWLYWVTGLNCREVFSVEQKWVKTKQGSSVPGHQAETRAKLQS